MFNITPNPGQGKRDFNKADLLAVCCLSAITYISQLLPVRLRLDSLYVCCVLLAVGQSLKKIIIYSFIACCLILITHLGMNGRPPLSWLAFANAGISIVAALITFYVAHKILKKNWLLEHSIAERTRNLAEADDSLKKSQSHLRTIFKTTDIAFLLLDSQMQILSFNATANYWSEHSVGKQLCVGSYFFELLNEERAQTVKNMMAAAMADQPINYESSYPGQDGNSEWYRISMNPVKDHRNQTIGLCCSAINTTGVKLVEIERARIADELVQRNQDLEQFSYIVSHNLRAPLANITGLFQILKHADISLMERMETENFLFQSILKWDTVVKDLNDILGVRRESKKKWKRLFSLNYSGMR